MKPFKFLSFFLSILFVTNQSSGADPVEVRTKVLERKATSGLELKGQLSQNITRKETRQVPYTVSEPYQVDVNYDVKVPYEDIEYYTEQVPYQDTETYYEKVPYQGTEEYYEQVPYEDTETYTEDVPYQDTEYYTEDIPYTDTETYTENVPYEEQESYIDSETTYTTENVCENVTEYSESCETEHICRTNPVPEGECTVEHVCRERNGQQICFDQKKCNPSGGPTEVCQDKNVCRRVPHDVQRCHDVSVPHTRSVTKYRTVTKYRQETHSRTVTKYRQETRTRTVTKYRQETRTRSVTKYRDELRTRTVTMYRDEARTRQVTRYREEQRQRTVTKYRTETKCCQKETRYREVEKCCQPKDFDVYDHQWAQDFVLRFQKGSEPLGNEIEKMTVSLLGSERAPDIEVIIDSQIFAYKTKTRIEQGIIIAEISIDPHVEPKDLGEKTIDGISGRLQEDGSLIIQFEDNSAGGRIATTYEVSVLDDKNKVVGKGKLARPGQTLVQIPVNAVVDLERVYSYELIVHREGLMVKGVVNFKTKGQVELAMYSQDDLGEATLTDFKIQKTGESFKLEFKDSGAIAHIKTEYRLAIFENASQKVIFEQKFKSIDLLKADGVAEIILDEMIRGKGSNFVVQLEVMRSGVLLKEKIYFKKSARLNRVPDFKPHQDEKNILDFKIVGSGATAMIWFRDLSPANEGVTTNYHFDLSKKSWFFGVKVAIGKIDISRDRLKTKEGGWLGLFLVSLDASDFKSDNTIYAEMKVVRSFEEGAKMVAKFEKSFEAKVP